LRSVREGANILWRERSIGHLRLLLADDGPDHRAGIELTQSTRIVQRKRRPTSKVD
jgi:hypothetical protein